MNNISKQFLKKKVIKYFFSSFPTSLLPEGKIISLFSEFTLPYTIHELGKLFTTTGIKESSTFK